MFIVYQATNKVNNKKYIGQTGKGMLKRWAKHVSDATTDRYDCYIHRAIRKHGVNSFEIKEIDRSEDYDVILYREIFWIAALQTYRPDRGYNSTYGGEGVPRTPEIDAKISASLTGRKLSPEHIANFIKGRTGIPSKRKGQKVPEATRLKMVRANQRPRVFTKEGREKISKTHKGRVISPETRKLQSEKAKLRGISPETRIKMYAVARAKKAAL